MKRLISLSLSILLLAACKGTKAPQVTKETDIGTATTTQATSSSSATGSTESVTESLNSAGEEHTVTLDNKDGTFVTNVKDLKVKMTLPQAWQIKKQKATAPIDLYGLATLSGASRHEVYDEKGNLLMAFCYFPYEDIEGQEDNLQAIYNQVALANHYHFIVRKEDENGGNKLAILEDTADRQVVYCMHYCYASDNGKPGEAKLRPGALVRFKKEHLYIAIYGDEKIDEKQVKDFAMSIVLA